MERLSRRSFMKLGVGGLAAGGLLACGSPRPALVPAENPLALEEEKAVASVCLQCPGGCGILVRIRGGHAISIRGNPDYPMNRGRLCPKGQAGLQTLYDPDRIRGPVRRVGPKGSGRWASVSWDEAQAEVVERLRSIRETHGPHTVAFLGGRYRGHMKALARRFMDAYGSPNLLGNGSIGSDGTKIAMGLAQGVHDYVGFDWNETNYVISFGGSWLEAFRPTTYLLRAYGHIRRGRPGRRAKLVHVDPRFSVTSAKADEWIPIRPGTDASLALGLAHVLVAEDLVDRDFIEEHTYGFEDREDAEGRKHIGFRRVLLEDHAPERVAAITGVEAKRIRRLAREFAASQPGIAVGERGICMHTNGVMTRLAVHALNALVGAINRPGGVLVQRQPPFSPLPPLVQDEIAEAGVARPRIDGAGTRRFPLAEEVSQALPEALRTGKPYPLQALLVYYTNPAFSRPDTTQHREALLRVPFLVSFSPFLDETSALADLILPDHTYLERWQDDIVLPSVGYPVFGLRQPVVPPLFDTRNTGDVLLDIARGLGGGIARSLPFSDYRALIRHVVDGVRASGRGSIRERDPKVFFDRLVKRGGWWDDETPFAPWDEVFRTPSGRYEFDSTRLREIVGRWARPSGDPAETDGGESEVLEAFGLEARGDRAFLPHHETPRFIGDPDEYPLHLITYKSMPHAEGRGANQPHLQEILGVFRKGTWESWAEVHPETARRAGLRDGDEAWVESSLGRIRIRIQTREGVRPDVLCIPFERGHRGYGRWARQGGANPNEITHDIYERLGGLAAWFATRVRLKAV